MRKMTNKEHIEGYVYQHTLALKISGETSKNPGTEYISGNLEIAVDEEMLNVIPVHFTYVTATTKSGQVNRTFANLKRIIDEDKSIVTVGKEEAIKVKVDTALALNDFYNNNDELVSAKTNEGGFVTITSTLGEAKARNQFEADMLITGVTQIDADEEKNIDEHYIIKGAIFDFRNALLPIELVLKEWSGLPKNQYDEGVKLFEGLDASPSTPVLKHIYGRINCLTTTVTRTEETAFGEAAVNTYERKSREWLITGASTADFDYSEDSNDLKPSELKQAMEDRNVYLAEVKKRADEYKAQRAAGTTIPTATTTNATAGTATTFTF